ncbi:MAG: hypothetical protein ACRDFQ_02295 [Anaerolineales bacterium]
MTFIAITHHGLTIAEKRGDQRSLTSILPDKDVRCLAVDPMDKTKILAGTQGEGLFRSDDRGKTWAQAGLAGTVIKSIAFTPQDSSVIYAGVKPAAVWRSNDAGVTWQELAGFNKIRGRNLWFSPAEPPGTAYVQGLAVSPTDPSIVVAGIEFGAVVHSETGGEKWSGHRSGALRDCHTLKFHFTNGDYVYEGGGTGVGAAISRDSGRTWHQDTRGLDRNYGWSVAADPADPELWYASLSPGPGKAHNPGYAEAAIFRKRGEASWEKLNGGLPDPINYMPYALLTDPQAPGHIVAGLANGEVWHSENEGETWNSLQLKFNDLRNLILV